MKVFVIPITTVLLSGVLSLVIARHTANEVLQGELDQGQAVFENIGFRYFYAFYGLYRPNEDEKSYEPSKDPKILNGYQATLADIQEDISWLRRNPIYGRLQNSIREFPLVQNHLAKEIVSQEAVATPATVMLMCRIYSKILQGVAIIDTEKDISKFAGRICAHFRSIQPGP